MVETKPAARFSESFMEYLTDEAIRGRSGAFDGFRVQQVAEFRLEREYIRAQPEHTEIYNKAVKLVLQMHNLDSDVYQRIEGRRSNFMTASSMSTGWQNNQGNISASKPMTEEERLIYTDRHPIIPCLSLRCLVGLHLCTTVT